jgi:hypothetical protein
MSQTTTENEGQQAEEDLADELVPTVDHTFQTGLEFPNQHKHLEYIQKEINNIELEIIKKDNKLRNTLEKKRISLQNHLDELISRGYSDNTGLQERLNHIQGELDLFKNKYNNQESVYDLTYVGINNESSSNEGCLFTETEDIKTKHPDADIDILTKYAGICYHPSDETDNNLDIEIPRGLKFRVGGAQPYEDDRGYSDYLVISFFDTKYDKEREIRIQLGKVL